MVITKNSFALVAISLLALAAAAVMPATVSAQSCTFTRTLYVGASGSDVFCLQNWLAAQGYFTVAATGYYGTVTQQAVIRWQLSQGQAATGVFSPESIRQLPPLSGTYTGNASGALTAIQNAVEAYEDARDEVDDARSGKDKDRAEDLLRDAQTELLASLQAFIAGDYNRAIDRAENAEEAAEDAIDEVDGRTSNRTGDKEDARDAIKDAKDALDDAWDEVNDARSGRDKDRAEDLLEEAEDLLDDAEDAYDDRDYDDAIDFAEEAEDLIDEALDEIGGNSGNNNSSGSEANAWRALNDAEDALEDAWDDVDRSNSSSSQIRRAEALLEDAQDILDDGWDAYEDRDYRDAIDYAEDAEDLIEDALDELD